MCRAGELCRLLCRRSAWGRTTGSAAAAGSTRTTTRGRSFGLLLATMTGPAADFLFTSEGGRVDVFDHLHHLPRGHFLRLFIAGAVFHVVAEVATHAKRGRDTEHGVHVGI